MEAFATYFCSSTFRRLTLCNKILSKFTFAKYIPECDVAIDSRSLLKRQKSCLARLLDFQSLWEQCALLRLNRLTEQYITAGRVWFIARQVCQPTAQYPYPVPSANIAGVPIPSSPRRRVAFLLADRNY